MIWHICMWFCVRYPLSSKFGAVSLQNISEIHSKLPIVVAVVVENRPISNGQMKSWRPSSPRRPRNTMPSSRFSLLALTIGSSDTYMPCWHRLRRPCRGLPSLAASSMDDCDQRLGCSGWPSSHRADYRSKSIDHMSSCSGKKILFILFTRTEYAADASFLITSVEGLFVLLSLFSEREREREREGMLAFPLFSSYFFLNSFVQKYVQHEIVIILIYQRLDLETISKGLIGIA